MNDPRRRKDWPYLNNKERCKLLAQYARQSFVAPRRKPSTKSPTRRAIGKETARKRRREYFNNRGAAELLERIQEVHGEAVEAETL